MAQIRNIRKIHFIEFRSKINTLIIKSVFPIYGGPLLATILRDQGYDVRMFLEGTSDMRFRTLADCDLICICLSLPAINKAKEFANRLRQERPRVPIIVGGPIVGLHPEIVLDFCDCAVRCEGDEVLPKIVECLNQGGQLETIEGVSLLRDGQVIHGPEASPPQIPKTIPDLELIDGFDRATRGLGKIFNVQNLIQTSRGCKHKCKFCPTSKLNPGVYRCRDIDSIIEEIRIKKKHNDWFLVVDNSFIGRKQRTRKLLDRIIEEDLDISLSVFERHEISRETELLRLMKKAGVDCLVIGVESLSDEQLDAFDKDQRGKDVISSIQTIKDRGIHVIASMVIGYDGDTPEKAKDIVGFITENQLGMTLFPLYDICRAGEDTLVPVNRRFWTQYQKVDPSDTRFFDYFTGHFVTYFPKTMKPSTLQKCIVDIYSNVYTHEYILKSVFYRNIFASLFGIYHGYAMRRMANILKQIVDQQYMDYLKTIEEGLYDENEVLIQEKLDQLDGLPQPPPVLEQMDLESYKPLIVLGLLPGLVRHETTRFARKIRKGLKKISGIRSLEPDYRGYPTA